MDATLHSINVSIFGEQYSIKGDVDSETTRKVAEYVNSKINELSGKSASQNKLKIAILSALNIAGELFECRAQAEEYRKQVDELQNKALQMNHKIDSTL